MALALGSMWVVLPFGRASAPTEVEPDAGPAPRLSPSDSLPGPSGSGARTEAAATSEVDAEDPATDRETVIVVVDRSMRPIQRAALRILGVEGDRLRPCDENGIAVLPSALIAGRVIEASARGWSTELLSIPDDPATEYSFELGHPGTLAGVVEMADGRRPPPGTRVFAWEEGRMTSRNRHSTFLLDADVGRSSAVGPDGTFSIGGLNRSTEFGLSASGPGVYSPARSDSRRQRPPTDEIRITCKYVVATIVAGPAAGRSEQDLFHSLSIGLPGDRGGATLDLDIDSPPGSEFLVAHDWVVRLHRPDLDLGALGLVPRLIAIGLDEPRTEALVGRVTVSVPGVGLGSTDIELRPVVDWLDIPTAHLEFSRAPAELGTVEVLLPLGGDGMRASEPSLPHRLALRPVGASAGDRIYFTMKYAAPQDRFIVHGVPGGDYEAWLSIATTDLTYPFLSSAGRIVKVIPGAVVSLSFEEVPAGSIRLEARDAHGFPHMGELVFELYEYDAINGVYDMHGRSASVSRQAPHRIDLVPAGEAYVRVLNGQTSAQGLFVPVTVEAGRVSTLELVID